MTSSRISTKFRSDLTRGHETESEYYSTPPHTWNEPRELAPEPSCDSDFPHQQLLFGLRNAGAIYQAALPKLQRSGKEIEFEYCSDSKEEKPLSGPAQGLVITSTPQGRIVYWPDKKPFALATDDNSRIIACLETLPYKEGLPLSTIQEEGSDTEVISGSTGSCSPNR